MANTYVPCASCGKINRVPVASTPGKEPICGHCRANLPLHGGVSEVNGAGLKTLVEKSPLPVLCDFWAPWCGPCKSFAPTFAEAALRLAGRVVFVKLNTEQHPQASGTYQVRGIPTLLLFTQGRELTRLSGALPLDAFLGWISGTLPPETKRPSVDTEGL